MPTSPPRGIKVVAVNRKARHNFYILETYEAGIELRGSEVKSIREGAINLKEGFAHLKRGELFLEGVHISPYKYASHDAPPPVRSRKLLLHRKEISRVGADVQQKHLTLVPLRVYFKKGKAKVEIGLAKGKKSYDKRETIRRRETERELDRVNKPVKSR